MEVATTRPETIMADMALAVHPGDARYRDVIGRKVWRPLVREQLPVVADDGDRSGVRHRRAESHARARQGRFRDRAAAQAAGHRRPASGRADQLPRAAGAGRAGPFRGAQDEPRSCCASAAFSAKEEPHENTVGFSERAGVPIEPRLSEQWFLRYPKTEEALAVVREHLIRFFPTHWEKVYEQWLTNIQDWCISRQVWWGHRIPAWYGPDERDPRAIRIAGRGMAAGRGHARYLVLVVALGLRNDGCGDAGEVLSDVGAGDRAGYHFLLGGAHDHRRAWSSSRENPSASKTTLPFRDVYFTGLIRDREGAEDEQVVRQFARPARADRRSMAPTGCASV